MTRTITLIASLLLAACSVGTSDTTEGSARVPAPSGGAGAVEAPSGGPKGADPGAGAATGGATPAAQGGEIPGAPSLPGCTLDLRATKSVGQCGGKGGGVRAGKKLQGTSAAVEVGVPTCAEIPVGVPHTFTLEAKAGDCIVVDFSSSAAEVAVEGPGIAMSTRGGSSTTSLHVTSPGTITMTVTSPSTDLYTLTVR
ncbi:MAG: hypothetical protein JNL38_15975 [Myxococcales bacterium]|jgi:hypothetical protein|nr:hypothetical protein [Myxococcales bacterium]